MSEPKTKEELATEYADSRCGVLYHDVARVSFLAGWEACEAHHTSLEVEARSERNQTWLDWANGFNYNLRHKEEQEK